jgi:hypothetical protein
VKAAISFPSRSSMVATSPVDKERGEGRKEREREEGKGGWVGGGDYCLPRGTEQIETVRSVMVRIREGLRIRDRD